MSNVLERFLRYVRIDTQSDPSSKTLPSSPKELDLARLLRDELVELGLQDVTLDANGYVMASLPANTPAKGPVLGFVSHMDTSPETSGTNVRPQLVENYDGGDVVLNSAENVVLSPRDFPELKDYVGQSLVTTDGMTLLGADDKAGVAEIMAALEELVRHPERSHAELRIAFTPDEEVARGTERFDVARFGAEFAYTVDGGPLGELQFENFNAASALVTIRGRNVHPGTAKGRMVHAISIAEEFDALVPAQERAQFTEGYEGFYHLVRFSGTTEEARLHYIVRDHDRERFEAKKRLLLSSAGFLNEKYGDDRVQVELHDQYYNMREKILPHMHLIETAEHAMRAANITPRIVPVRGGTDGAHLSYKGLPTPNLFTGGHNFHGRYEFIPVPSMEKAVETILNIAEAYAVRPAGA
jgi:tripeptide aminopeptidase